MRWMGSLLLVLVLCSAVGCTQSNLSARSLASCLKGLWPEFDTGSVASLRGISAVSEHVAWASGSGGTVLRTVDGGQTWQDASIVAAADLDFRMIHAFDERTAVALSAGAPARLYRTEDAGATWSLVYEDARPEIFFDGMRFADGQFGIAFGDPIAGRIQIITTTDGGRSWTRGKPGASPQALAGEAGFAASNSGVAIVGHSMYIGLGGQTELGRVRIARSRIGGQSWSVHDWPMRSGESSGIFSIAFSDAWHGVAVGGDYLNPDASDDNLIVTSNGGASWSRPTGVPPGGYRSAVVPLTPWGKGAFLAAGPNGSDVSVDFGRTWTGVDRIGWHALSVTSDGAWMWSSGGDGRVGRLDVAGPKSNIFLCP